MLGVAKFLRLIASKIDLGAGAIADGGIGIAKPSRSVETRDTLSRAKSHSR